MKLLISIATYKRPEKLQRCLDSLFHNSYHNFDIVVVADNNDLETVKLVNELNDFPFKNGKLSVLIQSEHKFVIGAWNRTIQEIFIPGDYTGFIGLCDDVILRSNALGNIVTDMNKYFPNTDGVLGFAQECPGHPEYTFKWYGQTLMGRKFIERYKDVNYQVCCPLYKHFYQDEEMFQYSSSLGNFYPSYSALLYHYHPGFIRELIDETHNIIRQGKLSPKEHDLKLFKERQSKGLVWGETWEGYNV